MALRKRNHDKLAKMEAAGPVFPIEEMEKWFDESLRRPFSLFEFPSWPLLRRWTEMEASVDMYEDGKDLVVKAELPGMTRKDIDVTLTDNMITISGEKKKEEKVSRKNYYRLERTSGGFTRSLRLPFEVDPEKIKASFKDGVLEIRAPKTKAAKEKTKKVLIS